MKHSTRCVWLLCLTALSGACRQQQAAGTGSAAPADSVRGMLAVTGAAGDQQIVVRSDKAAVIVDPRSPDASSLARLSGLEVLIRGAASGGQYRVTSFLVLRADGEQVTDGVLHRDGAGFIIESAAGVHNVAKAPVAFQDLVGARIWIRGPLDQAPSSYGVISQAAPNKP